MLSVIFFVNSILLGIGLAMDAFSVSLANGLNEPGMKRDRMSVVASVYAGFQGVMPMIGWVCVRTIVNYFRQFEKLIPWIAIILLVYIGKDMICEGINGSDDEESNVKLGVKELLIQGIATSIDALSVGFTISEYNLGMAIICAAIIAIVTFVICVAGLQLGKKMGTKLSGKADILGGIILIGIGIEIFVRGLFL